jgi:hypothetical protein
MEVHNILKLVSVLGLKHRLHSSIEENSIIVEWAMEYVKDS